MEASGGSKSSTRRRFLRTLAGAAALPALAAAPALAAKPAQEPQAKAHRGYRETAHVRAFYRSALGPR